MSDTSGPTSRQPFAYYDPDSQCLRTSQGTFPWDSTPSSLTLPKSGGMRNGWLFRRPTRVPATAASGSSSSLLLGTPRVGGNGQHSQTAVDSGELRGRLEAQVMTLLPTPVADNSRGLPSAQTDFQSLPNAVMGL